MSDQCKEYVSVPREAIEWLKEHFPALCVKAGLCEQIGKRLYTLTSLGSASAQSSQQGAVALYAAVGNVLEGWTVPDDVRKILETAYYAHSPNSDQSAVGAEGGEHYAEIGKLLITTGLYDQMNDVTGGDREYRMLVQELIAKVDPILERRFAASQSPATQTASESERRDAVEPAPSFESPLTPYGMLVRALRIVAGTTLYDMGKHLGCKPSTLSAVEFGRQPVTDAMLADTASFFSSKGVQDTLHALKAALPQQPAHDGSAPPAAS